MAIYVRPRLPSIFAKIHKARRAENFSGTENKENEKLKTENVPSRIRAE